jgi:hypothetical protein
MDQQYGSSEKKSEKKERVAEGSAQPKKEKLAPVAG